MRVGCVPGSNPLLNLVLEPSVHRLDFCRLWSSFFGLASFGFVHVANLHSLFGSSLRRYVSKGGLGPLHSKSFVHRFLVLSPVITR